MKNIIKSGILWIYVSPVISVIHLQTQLSNADLIAYYARSVYFGMAPLEPIVPIAKTKKTPPLHVLVCARYDASFQCTTRMRKMT